MDPRLKEVFDKIDQEKKLEQAKLAALEREKELQDKIKEENYKKLAAEWVDKNLFECIYHAEKNKTSVIFSDYKFYGKIGKRAANHLYQGIPARFLAEAASKIEGINIVDTYDDGYNDVEFGVVPPHTIYYVKVYK